jgi:hypothetical protein
MFFIGTNPHQDARKLELCTHLLPTGKPCGLPTWEQPSDHQFVRELLCTAGHHTLPLRRPQP